MTHDAPRRRKRNHIRTPLLRQTLSDALTSRGVSNYPVEHEEIVAALHTLMDAAKAESKSEFVDFAEKLMAHARMEEEVSYPTALLIGRYIKEKLTSPKVAAA